MVEHDSQGVLAVVDLIVLSRFGSAARTCVYVSACEFVCERAIGVLQAVVSEGETGGKWRAGWHKKKRLKSQIKKIEMLSESSKECDSGRE